METPSLSGVHSSDHSMWIWVVLAILLVVSALVGFGSLTLLGINQQNQQPTGSQAAPAR
jgi:flagellar basal body-associated protein FliL